MQTASPTVLVYHSKYTDQYTEMIRARYPHLDVIPCHNAREIEANVDRAEILAVAVDFPTEYIPRASRCRWIQVMGAGVERFVLSGQVPSHVVLTRARGLFGVRIAEYVFAHLLAATQRVLRLAEARRARAWDYFEPGLLFGQTLGIAGLGEVGREIGRRGWAFGMRVHGLDIEPRPAAWLARRFPPGEMLGFVRDLDVLVVALPLTRLTHHLFERKVFEQMKPSAVFVNVSRGGLVAEGDLADVLSARRIALAILDVFEQEPLPAGHPFWRLDNVVVTPHISGPAAPSDIVAYFLHNLELYLNGRPLEGTVDVTKGY